MSAIFACATKTEARAARRLGVRTAIVGIGARRGLPEGPVVSFGLAGGLHDGLRCGEVLDATRVVDESGAACTSAPVPMPLTWSRACLPGRAG